MPTIEVSNRRLGSGRFVLDPNGDIIGWLVDFLVDTSIGGASALGVGVDVDCWPLLTEGQRQQLRLIKDSLVEILNAW